MASRPEHHKTSTRGHRLTNQFHNSLFITQLELLNVNIGKLFFPSLTGWPESRFIKREPMTKTLIHVPFFKMFLYFFQFGKRCVERSGSATDLE